MHPDTPTTQEQESRHLTADEQRDLASALRRSGTVIATIPLSPSQEQSASGEDLQPHSCPFCDFSSGYRGMDRCAKCDGTGSIFRVGTRVFSNTREGHDGALAILASPQPHDAAAELDRLRADLAEKERECARLAHLSDYNIGQFNRCFEAEQEARARAQALESENQSLKARIGELVKGLEPFARYASEDGFGLNNKGEELPDGDGVGWVYLTNGDFRRARSLASSKEGQ